jgi:Glycoside hydrolase family 44
LSNAPDRRAHGNVPFLEWYLRNVRAAEQKSGKKILDVLDVHFYPQAEGMFGWGEKTDPEHAALRIRQTRGIWDPTYTDESWVGDQEFGKLALIPRMKKIIADNAPGLGFSVGEWNFGGEGHISGALATAEVLGRFGQGDVYSAFYWTAPPENSPTFWAFRAFRNYDGAGSAFLNNSVGTTMAKDTSLFASTNDQGTQLTAVVLNLDPQKAVSAQISLANCKGVKSAKAYTYAGGPSGFALASPAASAASMSIGVAPYSITVIRADLG